MVNFKQLCRDMAEVSRKTGEFILRESEGFDIGMAESKGLNDLVSYVDKGSEEMLVDKLGIILPEAGFITEEGTSAKKGSKYCWVIDPLDGTTNFVHGVHPFAISIALTEDNEPVAGVVYEVSGNEIYIAWKDGGAWLNDHPIHVSGNGRLSGSLVATGFPYSDFGRLDRYMDCFKQLCKITHGIRRLGSASIDLAYVACGRFDTFFEYGLHPWDIAAGTLLVREAGGRISDFSGNERNLSGDEVIAGNNLVYPEFLEIVSKFMHT